MKKMVFSVAALAFILCGCAANGSFKDREYNAITSYTMQTTQLPAKGSESEVEPGKSMLSSTRQAIVPAIRLEQDLNHQGKYSDVYDSLITVPAGVLTASGKDAGGTFYESEQPLLFVYQRISTKKNSEGEFLKGGIYLPSDAAQPAEVYWYWDGEFTPVSYPHPGLAYKTVTAERISDGGYRRELIYSGTFQNTVSIVYREFKDDLTRPVYFQDLKYDLAQGNVIAFQGARFQVLKADNTKVRYKVLNGLD